MSRSRLALLVLALAACGGSDVDPAAELPTYEEREVLFVDPEVLQAWIEGGHEEDVVFIDNRSQFVYDEQHIAGARLIPAGAVEDVIGSLPVNKWLVMYCT
jgi:hypothetical protein